MLGRSGRHLGERHSRPCKPSLDLAPGVSHIAGCAARSRPSQYGTFGTRVGRALQLGTSGDGVLCPADHNQRDVVAGNRRANQLVHQVARNFIGMTG